jgi:hypothetical protein
MKRIYFLIIQLLIIVPVWSQIAPGQWNFHLSMMNTKDVVEAGQKIYFLSQGGIYYFNKKDNSIEILSKNDGLSGSNFSGISYNEETKSVIVTYTNACIDVIREDNQIYPILDVKRKNISGDKTIYNITNYGKYCYLSCGFGIVVIDPDKLNIKDSYIIGDNGGSQTVYDVAFVDGYIFAGTREGIKYAPLEGVNLLDYSNWNYVKNIFLSSYSYNILEIGWNRLWAVHKDSTVWSGDRTFSRHAADVWYPEFEDYGVIHNLKICNNNLVYCIEKPDEILTNPAIVIYNQQKQKIVEITTYPFARKDVEINPRCAIMDEQGIVWIADKNYGGIRYENGNFTQLTPEGPFNNYVYSLTFSDGILWSASGGHDHSWGNMYFDFNVNEFSNNKWKSYNCYNGAVDKYIKDAFQVVPEPGNPNHLFVATWGYGIVELENGVEKNIYNEKNSKLQNKIPGDYYVRVGGLGFDSKGNLWATNSLVNNNLQKLDPNGEWESYYLPELANSWDVNVGPLMVANNDDIWMIVPNNKAKGLYVMSNDGNNKLNLDVKSYFTNGTDEKITDMNDVHSIVQDLDGAIWVGTSAGIAVYSNPENVFTESPFYASQPGLDLNDGIYHALFQYVTITAMAVDGGNRKWCGSKNDGLYLISADGQHEIEHFTTDNSPLISNAITSLAYDGTTGILYIGTELGLVSFRTDSKDSNESFGKVYAYPNPVRENYTGNIYITGLMKDTNVKITTVSGKLVYETTSFGGQAVWDGNDLAGNRVHTGVYLAFCASSDGLHSTVTKILFIR